MPLSESAGKLLDMESEDALTAEMTGKWLVTTQGTEHIWDLDRRTYTRRPTAASKSGAMAFDGEPRRIGRVQRWPVVGDRSWVWYDSGYAMEEYRISSTIVSIERMEEEDA